MMETPKRPDRDDVISVLKQLRATLAHALKQANISPIRFNEVRAQLAPLDEQLRNLGVNDFEILPQMAPTYIRPARHQRRAAAKKRNHASFTVRMDMRARNVK
jgi:hypothetical protein